MNSQPGIKARIETSDHRTASTSRHDYVCERLEIHVCSQLRSSDDKAHLHRGAIRYTPAESELMHFRVRDTHRHCKSEIHMGI